jgi:hypothetical protein
MDRELQTYYEALIETTNTPGWALMVADAERDRAMLNSVPHVKDAEHLFKTQGRILELDAFIRYKSTIRDGYEGLVAEEAAAAEARAAGEETEPDEAEIV